ncbi:hypothetical protein BDY19DRAFT_989559 [Irpex rosettiformis]|uniref:Uncharacterized protein n=1 Tax=Irpex rosettiformis TaxID=378272 RepID=A0ACB8UIG0_9APHY|nr:hypothetical protein BDY19DRAFT_989559 [Irpex rosettiformis]
MLNPLRARQDHDNVLRIDTRKRHDRKECYTVTSSNLVVCTDIVAVTTVVWWSPSSTSTSSFAITPESSPDSFITLSPDIPSSTSVSSVSKLANPPPLVTGNNAGDLTGSPSMGSIPSTISKNLPPTSSIRQSILPSSSYTITPPQALPTSIPSSSDEATTSASSSSLTQPLSSQVPLLEQAGPTPRFSELFQKLIPVLGAFVGFLVILATIIWLRPYIIRLIHRLGQTCRGAPEPTIEFPDTPAISLRDEELSAQSLDSGQREISVHQWSETASLYATYGSVRSMSLYDSRSVVGEACNALGSRSMAMAEWASSSIRPLPEPPGQNRESVQGRTTAEEVIQERDSVRIERHVFPSVEVVGDLGLGPEERSDVQGRDSERELEVGADGVHEQPSQSAPSQNRRNMSISGGSMSTIMTEPPPPYSPDGEPFNPADFDLSQVTYSSIR